MNASSKANLSAFSSFSASTASSTPSFCSSLSAATSSHYSEEYLSTDDILATSQRVTCKFEAAAPGLGFIDPASESEDIPQGTKLELPLWLAKVLISRKLVTVEVPVGYNATYREILEADATVVDLHKLGPNFYLFGKHLVQMNLSDSEEIAKTMVGTFYHRLNQLVDFSLSGSQDTMAEMLTYQTNLDNSELELLTIGRKSAEEYKQWGNRNIEKITANDMVTALKKRKRAADDTASSRIANQS